MNKPNHRIVAGTKAARQHAALTNTRGYDVTVPKDVAIAQHNLAIEAKKLAKLERRAKDRELLNGIALIEGR